jgi:hypothetical protein
MFLPKLEEAMFFGLAADSFSFYHNEDLFLELLNVNKAGVRLKIEESFDRT